MTLTELIDVLLDLQAAGWSACPVKVTAPFGRLGELEAYDVTVCQDEAPPYVRLELG